MKECEGKNAKRGARGAGGVRTFIATSCSFPLFFLASSYSTWRQTSVTDWRSASSSKGCILYQFLYCLSPLYLHLHEIEHLHVARSSVSP
jgi:hypothetical protein